MTRTHTNYFGGDLVDDLNAAIDALTVDAGKRGAFVDVETRVAMIERLEAVRLAAKRLRDRAD